MPDFFQIRIYRILLFLFLFVACQPQIDKMEGKVVGISDGDTIKILYKNRQLKVRLYGIDCPERTQPFGFKAKKLTSQLCFGKMVQVISHGKDRYGRILGEVILPDGKNLNEELVKNGFAWYYEKYVNDPALYRLEREAREEELGLWIQSNPTPPWDFRKNHSQ